MAILNQKRILNLIPKTSAPVTIHVSQGDVGTEIEFTLVKGDELFVNTGSLTASVHGVREDGANFGAFACTLSGSSVKFPLHSEMTMVKGSAIAEIVLVDSQGNKVGSANFGIMVEESVFPLGVTYDNDVSVYESILAYVQTIPAQVTQDYNTKINALNEALANETNARQSADTTINARIDELVAPSGEAPSAAEVLDARTGYDGTVYNNLGNAIRTPISDVNTALANSSYNVILETLIDYGTVWVDNNALRYDSSTTIVVCTMQGKNLQLEVGDVIKKSNNIQYRLIYRNSENNYSTLFNFTDSLSEYVVSTAGTYYMAIKYTDNRVIGSIAAVLEEIVIENVSSKAHKAINDLEELSTYRDNVIEKNLLNYILNDTFESGTLWVENNQVKYTTSDTAIRTKRNTYFELKAGDIIRKKDNIQYRLCYQNGSNAPIEVFSFNYSPSYYTIENTGKYYIAIKNTDDSTISDIEQELLSFMIINSDSSQTKDAKSIRDMIGSNSNLCYSFDPNYFEVNSIYLGSDDVITYSFTYDNRYIRTCKGISYRLNAGDLVLVEDDYELRLIKKTSQTEGVIVLNFLENQYEIASTGDYLLCIRKRDLSDISGAKSEAIRAVRIIRKESVIKRLIDDSSVRIDNRSKEIFCVMSYNTGSWYDGSGNYMPSTDYELYKQIHNEIFEKYWPDVIGLQEHTTKFCANGISAKDALAHHYYVNLEEGMADQPVQGKGIYTNRTVLDSTLIEYSQAHEHQRSPANYEKAHILMNGKNVCVISTHFVNWYQYNAVTELLTDVANEDYVIICVDTNVQQNDPTSQDYIDTTQRIINAGYKIANTNMVTHQGTNGVIDQIYVTNNIDFVDVMVDHTKDEYDLQNTDHYPLIAYIKFNS